MPSTNRVPPDLFGNQTAWSEPVDYILLDQQELDSLVRPAQRPPADLQEFADDAEVDSMQSSDILALQLFDTPEDDTPTECVSNVSGCVSNQSIVTEQ